MGTIYAKIYTSDYYEPSGIKMLFRTIEEYIKGMHDGKMEQLEEDIKRFAGPTQYVNFVTSMQKELHELQNLTQEQINEKYFVDLMLPEKELCEQHEIVKITIGKYQSWT